MKYFVGSAHFQNLQIDGVFMFGGKYIGTTQKTVDALTNLTMPAGVSVNIRMVNRK